MVGDLTVTLLELSYGVLINRLVDHRSMNHEPFGAGDGEGGAGEVQGGAGEVQGGAGEVQGGAGEGQGIAVPAGSGEGAAEAAY